MLYHRGWSELEYDRLYEVVHSRLSKSCATENKKGTPFLWSKIKPVCGIYVVNLKIEKFSPKFRNKSKEKSAVFERKQRIFGPSDRI